MKGRSRRHTGGNPQQRRLAEEVSEQQETLLQACWAHQLFNTKELRTVDGRRLEVVAPGWLNRGPGPDFTEARLLLEGEELWGDVEIHKDEGDWWSHQHQGDPNFQRVILHMVLKRAHRSAEAIPGGGALPVFDASPFLAPQVMESMCDPEEMLRRYERLPGRCGLRAAISNPEAVTRVITHAAEVRARAKAERIAPLLETLGAEQALFSVVFRYLGYRPHAALFERIAEEVPLKTLWPMFEMQKSLARDRVLALWFGLAGLLEDPLPDAADSDTAEEHARWKALWRDSGRDPLVTKAPRGGGRPFNAPERRLVGLFHHMMGLAESGWLKGWLNYLLTLDDLRDRKEFRREALSLLEDRFATPGDEPWSMRVGHHLLPLKKRTELIGSDRIIMLMANAVLPFFLAYARTHKDLELEKVLYRLYIVLPPEASNRRIRFMEQRLAGLTPLKPTLRTHQGLLQIHEDFCTSFLEGCEQCGFPDLISPVMRQGE